MKKAPLDRSRRTFLQTVGTGVPTLSLMLRDGACTNAASGTEPGPHSGQSESDFALKRPGR
jgi:hypothetical protein